MMLWGYKIRIRHNEVNLSPQDFSKVIWRYWLIDYWKREDANLHVPDTLGGSENPRTANNGTTANLTATADDHGLPRHGVLHRNPICQG